MRDLINDISSVLNLIDRCDLDLPDVFINALVSAEDRRFLFHPGVDPVAICRALYKTCSLKRLEGASTIEAQLFRVVTGRREISLSRKLQEIIAAVVISVLRKKREIAVAYLDNAFFGYKSRGIRYAADKYMCTLGDASKSDVALLISLIKRPMTADYCGPRRQHLMRRVAWVSRRIAGRAAEGNDGGA